MSDYEGDDWDPASLSSHDPIVQSGAFDTQAVPRSLPHDSYRIRSASQQSPGKLPRRIRVASQLQPGQHPLQSQSFLGPSARHGVPEPTTSSKPGIPLSFQRYYASPQSPDREYVMPKPWSELQKSLGSSRQAAFMTATRRLEHVSSTSETYIEMPAASTNRIFIWGTQEQCNLAVAQLDAWLMNLQPGNWKSQDVIWEKSPAYDGRKEHRHMQESYTDYANQLFNQADDHNFGFEAYLLWPVEYDLDAFLTMFESTAMRDISNNFRCHFYHEKRGRERYTRVRAQSEQDLLATYQRLIGMSRELGTRKSRGTHANFHLLPPRELCRDSIMISKDVSNKAFTIRMTGEPLDESCEDEWKKLAYRTETRVYQAISNALTTFIQNLHVSKSHIRLRVDFGQLRLVSFQNLQRNSDCYHIDDFIQMIQNPSTKFSECHLNVKNGDMFRLVDILKQIPQQKEPEDTFTAQFDFVNPSKSSGWRLEAEHVSGYDAGETQIHAQRWLDLDEDAGNRPVLDLKVLDLVQPSFIIRASCSPIADESKVTREMKGVQNAYTVAPKIDGLTSFPKKRLILPPGQRELATVTEVTAVKMRLQNTEGTFEVRREDKYDHRYGKDNPWPVSSEWTASYYYLGWDIRLDEFDDISPGEDVSWSRNLSAFFPESSTQSEMLALPRGFKKFWEEIRLIQTYLAEAMSRLSLCSEDKPLSKRDWQYPQP